MPVGTTWTRCVRASGICPRISSARSLDGATIAAQAIQKRTRYASVATDPGLANGPR
jgi:hypothetical protein